MRVSIGVLLIGKNSHFCFAGVSVRHPVVCISRGGTSSSWGINFLLVKTGQRLETKENNLIEKVRIYIHTESDDIRNCGIPHTAQLIKL